MTEKLTNKFKGFFRGDAAKHDKAPAELKRGVPANMEELTKWVSTKEFIDLDKRGQESFFKFLRGDVYTEDIDVIFVSVKADGMDGDAKRYQFWLKCENFDLKDLFDVYVVDDETKLKDATESFQDRDDMKEKAKKVEDYVSNLKIKMKPDLDEQFSKFQKFLPEYKKLFSP